ncbi:hypothetical protein Y88_1691 [Novosphingobium nitrogenifigens DSM 19370]|uniref:Uncharacterized protein n=1 Tax=Novosphingobium nitrogenifigens DSM 19370 TaxID=983920 RepID=F1Z3I9_9SPHN|nr:hypothetical protein Y88_1691 [Novosphingobium nitrogenifigens DSM 19370]
MARRIRWDRGRHRVHEHVFQASRGTTCVVASLMRKRFLENLSSGPCQVVRRSGISA